MIIYLPAGVREAAVERRAEGRRVAAALVASQPDSVTRLRWRVHPEARRVDELQKLVHGSPRERATVRALRALRASGVLGGG